MPKDWHPPEILLNHSLYPFKIVDVGEQSDAEPAVGMAVEGAHTPPHTPVVGSEDSGTDRRDCVELPPQNPNVFHTFESRRTAHVDRTSEQNSFAPHR